MRLEFDARRIKTFLRIFPVNLRKGLPGGLHGFGNLVATNLIKAARAKNIKQFRKNRSLFTDTKFVPTSDGGYVKMPKSGLYQDRAQPHWVPAYKYPMARAWAHRYLKRPDGSIPAGFYFRPKPFIRVGVRNSLNRLAPSIRPVVRGAIKESF